MVYELPLLLLPQSLQKLKTNMKLNMQVSQEIQASAHKTDSSFGCSLKKMYRGWNTQANISHRTHLMVYSGFLKDEQVNINMLLRSGKLVSWKTWTLSDTLQTISPVPVFSILFWDAISFFNLYLIICRRDYLSLPTIFSPAV